MSIPVARKQAPVKSPKKSSSQQARSQDAEKNSIKEKKAESIKECNEKMEDQKEAEKLRLYLNKEFPDVLKELLAKDDRMDVDLVELVMLNEDVEPHYHGWAQEVPVH